MTGRRKSRNRWRRARQAHRHSRISAGRSPGRRADRAGPAAVEVKFHAAWRFPPALSDLSSGGTAFSTRRPIATATCAPRKSHTLALSGGSNETRQNALSGNRARRCRLAAGANLLRRKLRWHGCDRQSMQCPRRYRRRHLEVRDLRVESAVAGKSASPAGSRPPPDCAGRAPSLSNAETSCRTRE